MEILNIIDIYILTKYNKKSELLSSLFVIRVANRETWKTILLEYLVNL
jgi:hypothetical protein